MAKKQAPQNQPAEGYHSRSLRIPDVVWEEIWKLAASMSTPATRVTPSAIVRTAIREYLARLDRKIAKR